MAAICGHQSRLYQQALEGPEGREDVTSTQRVCVHHHPLMSESPSPSSRPGGGRDELQLLMKIRVSLLPFHQFIAYVPHSVPGPPQLPGTREMGVVRWDRYGLWGQMDVCS